LTKNHTIIPNAQHTSYPVDAIMTPGPNLR
jgi:hypothetical protein